MNRFDLTAEVRDFVERLGRVVEEPRPGRLVAKHRTALVEESTDFVILDDPSSKPLKRGINILPVGHLGLDKEEYPKTYFFDDFLDSTVNAQMLATTLKEDDKIKEKAAGFIPQNLSQGGQVLPTDARQFFSQEWLPDEDRRLLAVLGPAGYGKTVLSSALALNMAEAYITAEDGARPPFPYLIDFGQFRRLASFEAMILTSLEAKGITDYTSSAFAYLVTHRRVVLILDGFDELLEERPEEAQRNLRELIETLGGLGKVLITARSTFFRTSDDVADFLEYYLEPSQVSVVELSPFDTAQRHAFIVARTEDGKEAERIEAFVNSPGLDEAMGSPLLLKETIEALLEDSEGRLDRPTGRRDLFALLESKAYERERTRQAHLFSNEVQQTFLEELAKELLQDNSPALDKEDVEVYASLYGELADGDDAACAKLVGHHFLTVNDESKDKVRFNHQVFREYFQARALIKACSEGDVDLLLRMLNKRPIPEAVREFCCELDEGAEVPKRLLEITRASVRPSERLASNVASVCVSYNNVDLIHELLDAIPAGVPFELEVQSQDLRGLRWSDRYLTSLKLTDVDLRGTVFDGTVIGELILADTNVEGTVVSALTVDSLAVGYGKRVFGTHILVELAGLGADAGLEEGAIPASIAVNRHAELIEMLRRRLKRFYNAGEEGVADSTWDKSISERNLLGGVAPAQAKFMKSQVIPAMLKAGLLERRRMQGQIIYDLSNASEDDARALLEREEVVGVVEATLVRLERGLGD